MLDKTCLAGLTCLTSKDKLNERKREIQIIYIYIYIKREREKERERDPNYIYIYIEREIGFKLHKLNNITPLNIF